MPDPYSQLLEWRRNENASRGLGKLPHDFYAATRAYLADLRRTYEAELRENPSSRKGEVARHTHQRATQLARDLVEARVTKLLSSAFQATVGGSRDVANLLNEERDLLSHVTTGLRAFRASVTPYLELAAPSASTSPPAPSPVSPSDHPTAPAGGATTAAREAPAARAYVRVVQDRPALEIGGETLELHREDVISVTPAVARLLVDGKVAVRFEPTERRREPAGSPTASS